MSWWGKRSVRVLLVTVAVLLLAAVAVKIFLPAEKIRDIALAQARTRLGREITVEGVSVSLKGGLGVKLTEVAIHNPEGFTGAPLVTARSFDLKLAIKPLLKKQIQVNRLVLDQPVLNLSVTAAGGNNFTFAQPGTDTGSEAAPRKAAPAPVVNVPNLTVSQGEVVYSDARSAGQGVSQIRVNRLGLSLSLDSTPDGGLAVRGKAEAPEIAVTAPQPVPTLAAEAEYDIVWQPDPAAVTLNTVTARINGIPLSCTGQIALEAAGPSGTVNVQLPEQPLTGLLVFAPPEVGSKIKGSQDSGRVSATVDLVLTGRRDDPVHTSGTAAVRDVDLSLAQPFLPPEKGAAVAGRGDLDLTFALDSPDPEQLTYGGTATVRGLSYSQPDLMDQLQSLDGELLITPEKYTVKKCRARFASGTFDLTGSLRDPLPYFLPPELQKGKALKTPHLEFTLTSKRLDVDKLLPAASPAAKGQAKGKPAAPKPLPPIEFDFPDITGQGTFAADSLLYMQMPFTQVAGKVRLKNQVMACSDIQGNLYGGTVGGTVDIDLKDLNTPAYAGTYQAQGIEVNQFLARFVDLTGVVYGGAGLQGNFAARGRDPLTIQRTLTLDSAADIRQGRVITTGNTYQALNKLAGQLGQTLEQEQGLRDLATRIHVKDGKVGLKDLKTQLGQLGEVTFGGTYAFTGELDYAGQILLTEAATTRLFTSGVLAELGKLLGSQKPQRLALPLTVGGVRTDPKVQFDLGTVTADLQQRVVKEQGNKLEDEAKKKLNDLMKKWK